MRFEQMLRRAKGGDKRPSSKHFASCTAPCCSKYAVINGRLDEDLYQELCITLMRAIELFRI